MPGEFDENEINQLLLRIFSGNVNLFNLPENIYEKIATLLSSQVLKGFGLDESSDLTTPERRLPRHLKKNTYVFSAAKTFQQVLDMQNQLFDKFGNRVPFQEFEDKAKIIFDTYNRNWLEAEFEMAERIAEEAERFQEYEKESDIFPYLRYKTLEDPSVREEHRSLNEIVRPVGDRFWNTHLPPNGWRCRCFVEQLTESEGKTTDTTGMDLVQPNKLFNFNPAKEGVIFRESAQGKGHEHPYFKVEERFEVHKRNNFGMPLPPDVQNLEPFKDE